MQVRPLSALLLVPYLSGNLVAALLLTTSGLAAETVPPSIDDLKRPPAAAQRFTGTHSSAASSNGAPSSLRNVGDGSSANSRRPAVAGAGGNGAQPMGASPLDTGEASASGNGTDLEFRRQNGSGRTGSSAGPVRLPVGRDVSARAGSHSTSHQGKVWASGLGGSCSRSGGGFGRGPGKVLWSAGSGIPLVSSKMARGKGLPCASPRLAKRRVPQARVVERRVHAISHSAREWTSVSA